MDDLDYDFANLSRPRPQVDSTTRGPNSLGALMAFDFTNYTLPRPDLAAVESEHQAILDRLSNSESAADTIAIMREWDEYRRQLYTWEEVTLVRFEQDTQNETYKTEREFCDEIRPKMIELSLKIKCALLESPHREAVQAEFGSQAFELWDVERLTYDPAVEKDMVEESKLGAKYTELLAAAKLNFRGEELNLSELTKFYEEPDRETRHEAQQVYWGFFSEYRTELDEIYDSMVKLRTAMAKKLGYETFTELGYKRMSRIDYNREDVERFRDAVRSSVTPFAQLVRDQQQEMLNVDQLMHWDETIHDPAGNPKPKGDHDWMLERAQEMFDTLGLGLDEFFRLMTDAKLLDLKTRSGKAGGGFCTGFPAIGLPFIFANFNGTKGDVEVFTHEVGHAFQNYCSRNQPLYEYLWPTYESCEIHSMSLEFLTWPQMELFFGEDAERFRKVHLTQGLLFLPYGVAVDHFQHMVYDEPDATPERRHEMWSQVEEMYLPWKNYGDLTHPATGGFWHRQQHIFGMPFYYIDYTLAQTCALQFWVRSRENFSESMDAYVKLCTRGGEAPFQQLATSAGLVSPFQEGCLEEVVSQARAVLGV